MIAFTLLCAATSWLTLANTLPTPTSIDELPAPSAYTLLDWLVSGERGKTLPCTTIKEDRSERTGFCGAKDHGYKWREVANKDTDVELVGVDGITLVWRFSRVQVGQAGHEAFAHKSLRARFRDDEAKRRFSKLFHDHFGLAPSWGQL